MTQSVPSPSDLTARIRTLAAQGLRVRDISSLLHIHPMIVIREIERSRNGVSAIESKEAPHA